MRSVGGEWLSGDDDAFLGVGAAARLAGVSVDTIRRWCANGRLPYRQGGPNNHRRIRRGDLFALLSGEGTEPRVRGGGGHRRLPQVVEEWTQDVEELLPWSPGPLDTADRITRVLVALRGYSSEGGRGGLIGRLLDLIDDLETSVTGTTDEDVEMGPLTYFGTDDEEEPGYLRILRHSLDPLSREEDLT